MTDDEPGDVDAGTVGDRGEAGADAVDLDVDTDDPEALADRLRTEVALRENLSRQIDVLEDVVEGQRELLRCTAEVARLAAQAGDEGLDADAVEAALPAAVSDAGEGIETAETAVETDERTDERSDADPRGYY